MREATPVGFSRNIKVIRVLIAVYFFFLIFEGFLRMVLPPLSNALIVVRDPFLLAAYMVALASGIFPWNRFVVVYWLLGLIAVFLGLFDWPQAPVMVLYGFRYAFLHVPLIFLMGRVLTEVDVLKYGRWFLILSIPIALLMAAQFAQGPDSWLNRGLDNQFKQISGAEGRIRAPGTFTFVLGPSIFYAFVVAFLIQTQFRSRLYSRTLVLAASIATCLALAISISRYALVAVGIVVLLGALAVVFARPAALGGFLRFGVVIAVAFGLASQLPVFSEGMRVFGVRIEQAGNTKDDAIGFVERMFWDVTMSVDAIGNAQVTGAGLGTGSNIGANLLFGRSGFLLAENEWPRIILELGPFMGVALILMRVGLTVWLLLKSIRMARSGVMLPTLLFAACGPVLFTGTWSQATALGFAIFGAGLCLASMNVLTVPVGQVEQVR